MQRILRFYRNSVRKILPIFHNPSWATKAYLGWVLIGLSLLPLVLILIFNHSMTKRACELDLRLKILENNARVLAKVQKQRDLFLREFGGADENFLANYIESEVLLSEDIHLLKKISRIEEYATYKPIGERIAFLTGEKNKINFCQMAERKCDFYKEKLWHINSPVEMNCEDIKKILSRIEGVKIDKYLPNPLRPLMMITKFDVSLKPQDNHNKVFSVEMEILQRGCYSGSE